MISANLRAALLLSFGSAALGGCSDAATRPDEHVDTSSSTSTSDHYPVLARFGPS